MNWAASLFRNMCYEDFNTAEKFLKSILEDECVAESHAFRDWTINLINSEQNKDVKYNMVKILDHLNILKCTIKNLLIQWPIKNI